MQHTTLQPGDLRRRRVRSGLVVLCILMAFMVIAVGCGKSRSNDVDVSPAARDASLKQIAADYARSGDLAQAQAALDKLGLANPTQLLVSLAETEASAGQPAAEIAPMARLAEALGARSAKLIAYLAPTPTAVPPTPVPSPIPPSPTAAPSATATPEPPPATSEPPTSEPPTVTPTPEPQQPRVVTDSDVNLRGGPGKAYPVVGKLLAGQETKILGRNASGDWWQLAWPGGKQAWVAGTVVQVLGPIDTVAVAKNIPAPPVQPTRAPQPTAAPTAPPKPAGPDFQVTNIRLWGVQENGGFFDGPSLHCGEKRQLRVTVLDAAGNALNGVTVKSALTGEEQVTGSKGPGIVEYVLGGGQDLYIVRDADGHDVSSDTARGMSTDPHGIATEVLMGAGYCKDAADCDYLRQQWACKGHYSWDVTFRRAY